jgi:hypothetical protein
VNNKGKKFVNVGFEFTAALKPTLHVKNKSLVVYNRTVTEDYAIFRHPSLLKISEYSWINKNFEYDDCGCEVPTPIIRKKVDVEKYYLQFMEFVKESNLTTDIDKAYCGLGGCHIHLDLSHLSYEHKILQLKNIAILLSNNPWLNWALNDPNDNINANSLLCKSITEKVEDCLSYLSKIKVTKKIKQAESPLEIFLTDPIHANLNKNYAMRYNHVYDTVEIRIFNMPLSLEEHLFHYNIAMAIYNFCLNITEQGNILIQRYQTEQNYTFLEGRLMDKKIISCLTELGITPTRAQINKMLHNVQTRYKWSYDDNLEFKRTGVVKVHKFYLL